MSVTLNEIFDKILGTEERAESKKQHLMQIKNKIAKLQLKEKELQEEKLSLKTQILIKTQKLCERQRFLQCLRNKEIIFKEQKEELLRKKAEITEDLNVVEEELAVEREKLCHRVEEFCADFVCFDENKCLRRQKCKNELTALKSEEQKLLYVT
ncbi:uncharacterized protein LOC111632324 [Centruroides sculpturatus]|uniref:uncharacterized protein LOC111632324 n=1 Tax=Centruroides sculpturatus TaxID=218467 RepID=UPI000C6DECBA|nr:uncharacterized protein LOC111632324 [Centruroides sculpturatus]